MFLSAKKDQTIPVSEELKKMNEKLPGPFLQAKKQIEISAEFLTIIKKFEKRFQTPIKAPQSKESEMSTIKIDHQKKNTQLKIMNVFNIKKRRTVKGDKETN